VRLNVDGEAGLSVEGVDGRKERIHVRSAVLAGAPARLRVLPRPSGKEKAPETGASCVRQGLCVMGGVA
jgi:hypothetical protein